MVGLPPAPDHHDDVTVVRSSCCCPSRPSRNLYHVTLLRLLLLLNSCLLNLHLLLSLTIHLDRLINQCLSICCLDYLRLLSTLLEDNLLLSTYTVHWQYLYLGDLGPALNLNLIRGLGHVLYYNLL